MSADIHLVGVCGTFMAGVALLAEGKGAKVEGSDKAFYPPMSDQLGAAGIVCHSGYEAPSEGCRAGLYVIGNAISRGNPMLEALMRERRPFTSGPQWLFENVLSDRRVVAVSGTHGKTTVTSMVAFILDRTGHSPGFLVGGIPPAFGVSARLGEGAAFVVEADEYDTAFFDKRPKFLHYRPEVAVLNNLEFDHADIYPDMEALTVQFQRFLRTVPDNGTVVANAEDAFLLEKVVSQARSKVLTYGLGGDVSLAETGDGAWHVVVDGKRSSPSLPRHIKGRIYRMNALAAVSAALAFGVDLDQAVGALTDFRFPVRRMELIANWNGCPVYDDFAHHPTAISSTIEAVKEIEPGRRVIAVFDPRSNTMKSGHWNDSLSSAFGDATVVVHQHEGLAWKAASAMASLGDRLMVAETPAGILKHCIRLSDGKDVIVLMTNGDSKELRNMFAGATATPVEA